MSIDAWHTGALSPSETVMLLINSGWECHYRGTAIFLDPHDHDDFDWKSEESALFDINRFLSAHRPKDKVGIVMTVDQNIGGEFLFYENWFSLSPSIETRFMETPTRIPDFGWYLKKMEKFLDSITLSRIECTVHY